MKSDLINGFGMARVLLSGLYVSDGCLELRFLKVSTFLVSPWSICMNTVLARLHMLRFHGVTESCQLCPKPIPWTVQINLKSNWESNFSPQNRNPLTSLPISPIYCLQTSINILLQFIWFLLIIDFIATIYLLNLSSIYLTSILYLASFKDFWLNRTHNSLPHSKQSFWNDLDTYIAYLLFMLNFKKRGSKEEKKKVFNVQ